MNRADGGRLPSASQRPIWNALVNSDEHLTRQVYHAQSRFGFRWIPHADSGQPCATGLELAGFRVQLSRQFRKFSRLATATDRRRTRLRIPANVPLSCTSLCISAARAIVTPPCARALCRRPRTNSTGCAWHELIAAPQERLSVGTAGGHSDANCARHRVAKRDSSRSSSLTNLQEVSSESRRARGNTVDFGPFGTKPGQTQPPLDLIDLSRQKCFFAGR